MRTRKSLGARDRFTRGFFSRPAASATLRYFGLLAMASTVINVSPREKAAAVCRIITGRKRGDGTFSALGRVIYREAAAGHRLAFSAER